MQYHYSSSYPNMPLSLTYLAHQLMDVTPHRNLAWSINVTERVVMVAVEWHRQLYTKCKIWPLDQWMYDQFYRLDVKLGTLIGIARNVEDLFALLKRANRLLPELFKKSWPYTMDIPDSRQLA